MADAPVGTRLRVPLDMSVPRLLTQAGYLVESTRPTRSTRLLIDTTDRRLAAAGGELSLNARDGWRWRRNTLGHPKLSAREWTAPPDAPPAQLMGWTRAYRRGRPIAARLQVTVHSRRHLLRSPQLDSALTVVEERLDERAGSGLTPRLRHVEVIEADTFADAALAALRDASLPDAAPLSLLGPAGRRAPALVIPGDGEAGTRAVFARSARLALLQWLYHDCELGAGTPEALRKLRVALRRLRSDLQTFSPVLDRQWADALRDQLGSVGRRFGQVRDGEVLGERLAGLAALLPESERAAALPLLDIAGSQLALSRAHLLAEVGGVEYIKVLDSVTAAVTSPRWETGDPDPPATRLARRPWRRLRSYVASLDNRPAEDQLHRVRILAKRARYAADACVPAAGEPAAKCAALLADLQTVLGEHHDASVTREWLRVQSQAMADTSFIAGEMSALELARIRRASERWRASWDKASRPGNWRWLRS